MRDGLPNPDFQLSYEAITDKLPVLEACIKVSCAHGGAWSQLASRPGLRRGGGLRPATAMVARGAARQSPRVRAGATCRPQGGAALKHTIKPSQESMRLLPGLGLGTVREASEDVRLGDIRVEKGTQVGGCVPA